MSAEIGRWVRLSLADRAVRATLVVWAFASLPYALPLGQAWLAEYQLYGLFPALLVLVVAACLAGLRRVDSWQERQFWTLIALGFGAWLASYAPYSFATAPTRRLRFDVADELLYLLFYSCLLLAIDLRPHLSTTSRAADVERWLKSAGAILLAFAGLVYFVLVPVAWNPRAYLTWTPSLLLYVALDGFVLLRLTALALRSRSPRWRVLYGGLAMATLLMLGTDVLEYLRWAGILALEDGRPTDLVWTLPLVAFALVARLRELPVPARAAVPWLATTEDAPARTGSFLLLCALSAPVVHFTLYGAGLLDAATHRPREWIVLATVVVLGGLAVQAYRSIERERLGLRARRRELEAQARRADRVHLIAKLSEGLAHEFGNLLQVIGGRCDPLLVELPAESPIRADVQTIRDATRRMATAASQLLELLRTRFGEPRRVRLSEVVQHADHLVQALAGDEVAVTVRLRAARDHVHVDQAQLERAILSLVANAVQAMPGGGTLAIETFDIDLTSRTAASLGLLPGPYAAVSVKDGGVGMSDETRARAFEPFFTTRPGPDRPGLGLTAALLVASHYGGTVHLESAVGRGTTAIIYLPRADARGSDAARGRSVEATRPPQDSAGGLAS